MLVPVEWLEEYVQPGIAPGELAERLALTGTEVDRVHEGSPVEDEKLVVGRVLECGKHPDADRLSVCTVDVGAGEPSTIVCGAPNVAAGQAVAVALPGARLPDGTKIRKSKLRGVPSAGMILSEREIGLGDEHDGIMVLDDGTEPGTPLADALPAPGVVLELEITPNRPDCLGIYGVAREVHAATGAPLADPPWALDPGGNAGPGPGGNRGFSRGARPLPALHRPGLRERHDRPVAGLAGRAAARGRSAADQQRRRHHQLRDAALRPPAPRLRP